MRTSVLAVARAALLTGPTALAFFAGGYFDEARAWAGVGVWALVAVAIALRAGRAPRRRASWIALIGIGLLAGWTLASMAWAPIAGDAYHAGQLVVLYTGALLAALLLLRSRSVRSWVEPALAGGILIVIGYGVSERLLPGLLHFSRSVTAQGRLEQPLTYWNAMGELAAIGFVLCVRLSGDRERPRWIGGLAAAACAPLGLGLYLSFSRGALFACVAGLVALIAAAPRREQVRALVIAVVAGGLSVAGAAPFGGVTSLVGHLSTRERQGAIALAVLLVAAAIAVALHLLVVCRSPSGVVALPRRAGWLALALICGGLAVAIVVGAKETTTAPRLSGGAARLVSLESNRYAYWRVALQAFGAQPVHGVGAGGWAVWWLNHRTVNDFARDAHSLPLQTAAELGLVGLAALAMLFGGVALASGTAHRLRPGLTSGPLAALVSYAAHAPLDWDWQMPAVTLVAMVLAGFVLALAEAPADHSVGAPREAEQPTTAPRRSAAPAV